MRRLALCSTAALSLWLAVLTPQLARAADWTGTFPSEAVASYFGAGEHPVLVAASGEASDALATATTALEAALRGSASFPLVMDAKSLGDLSQLDDGAIVQKAAHLPVERIAIVRVFAGSEGAEPTALVTIYGKGGDVITGFSAKPGTALAAHSDDAGSGVNRGVAETVSTMAGTSAKSRSAASEEYDKNFIWFQDLIAINVQGGGIVGSSTIPYQGKYKKPLDGAAFYEAIERPDLASSYRTRQAVRLSLFGVGYAAIIGAPIYTLLLADSCDGIDPDCDDSKRWVVGGAMFGGGLVLAITAGLIAPHPIAATEARQLADEHNMRLKERLGLASQEKPKAQPIQAGFFATRDGGGGLTLGGSF